MNEIAPLEDAPRRTCRACEGEGYVRIKRTFYCRHCGGTGLAPDDDRDGPRFQDNDDAFDRFDR